MVHNQPFPQQQNSYPSQTLTNLQNQTHIPQNTQQPKKFLSYAQATTSFHSNQTNSQLPGQQTGDLTSVIISMQQTILAQQQTINELTMQIRLLREEMSKK